MADKPITPKVTVSLYGDYAERLRRVATLMPHTTLNRIGVRALLAGLDVVERELREAARSLATKDDQHDAEGL